MEAVPPASVSYLPTGFPIVDDLRPRDLKNHALERPHAYSTGSVLGTLPHSSCR